MEAVRRHPLAAASVLAAVAVLIALVVPLPGSQGGTDRDGAAASPSTPGFARPSAGATPSMTPAAESDEEPAGLVRRPSTVRGEPSGLAGDGGSFSIRMRRITIAARSSEPIGVVGYNIPTSRVHPSGVARGVGRSWSLSTTVYGRPDYAQMFLQAGPSGASITCTITVDGRVTERRASKGPYGQLFCQG